MISSAILKYNSTLLGTFEKKWIKVKCPNTDEGCHFLDIYDD